MSAQKASATEATASTVVPPFSPVLLAGFLMRPFPLAPLNHLLARAMKQMHGRHSHIFDRMEGVDDVAFYIDPVDLPFAIRLDAEAKAPRLKAIRKSERPAGMTRIAGSLASLLAMLEGRIDGDALFFSRELTIEGDTEAVVALRNAVDGSEIDLVTDFAAVFGPLKGPTARAMRLALGLGGNLARDFETLRSALVAPVERRVAGQEEAIDDMDERLTKLARVKKRKGFS